MHTSEEQILSYLIFNGGGTIPGMAADLGISIGTTTKWVSGMCREGFVRDSGVMETASGRKPHRFELNPAAGCFLGIDIADRTLSFGLMDFAGRLVDSRRDIPFALQNTPQALEKVFSETDAVLREWPQAREKLLAAGIMIPGRVNMHTGKTYTNFSFTDSPLAEVFRKRLGCPVLLCNDTHAMTCAEYMQGHNHDRKNLIYINVNWGLGAGIIIDGKLYSGKSGYAGELGHVYGFDNEILCRCGKKGCIETEISGQALRRKLTGRIRSGESSILSRRVLTDDTPLTLPEIMDAVHREDVLCIDVIEEVGRLLGIRVAGLVNLFNPELVVIGGELSLAGDYLLQPLKTAINKFSINLVNQDTEIRLSSLGEDGAVLGACLMARAHRYNVKH